MKSKYRKKDMKMILFQSDKEASLEKIDFRN